jgi:hypothetical protein
MKPFTLIVVSPRTWSSRGRLRVFDVDALRREKPASRKGNGVAETPRFIPTRSTSSSVVGVWPELTTGQRCSGPQRYPDVPNQLP